MKSRLITHSFNENFFETIDSEDKAYWLGFIAADGAIHKRKGRDNSYYFNVNLQKQDKEHLQKLNDILGHNKELIPLKKELRGIYAYRLRLCSLKLCLDLIDKGITPRKSLTLKPPINVPDELIRHWIRGYFDGDGSFYIRKKKNKLNFKITSTKEILQWIQDLVKIKVSIPDLKKSKAYTMKSNKKDSVIRFVNYIYKDSTIFLERKMNKCFIDDRIKYKIDMKTNPLT